VENQGRNGKFEQVVVPHLNAAYNLAAWLLRDDSAAQDAVQEAFVRALRFFDSFHGCNAKPWLLQIVRNTCWTYLQESGRGRPLAELDEDLDSNVWDPAMARAESNPEVVLSRRQDSARVNAAIEALPIRFREVLILREMEGLAYVEIAEVAGLPLGTVMSRLYRARALLKSALTGATSVPSRSPELLASDRTREELSIGPWPRPLMATRALSPILG
jgi:RNA polymerase sigma-70 factor, ECF subfamily